MGNLFNREERGAFAGVKFQHIAIVTFVAMIATGLPQPIVLGRLPFLLFLSRNLHCDESQISRFFFLVTIPWLFMKPVFGLISDSFPIFKTRRRHYLMVSAVLSALSWLAFIWVPHQYTPLAIACFTANLFMAFGSAVACAVLVEAGRPLGAVGRLTSVRVIGEGLLAVITQPLGGFLAGVGLAVMAGANAAVVLALVPITFLFLKERPNAVRNPQPFKDAGEQIKTFFRSKTVWLVLLAVFLFYFAPGFATVQGIRQNHLFGLSGQRMGWLGGISAMVGLAVAFAYPSISLKLNLKSLIPAVIVLSALSNVFYLLYSRNFGRDAVIDSQAALFYMPCELIFYNLIARATPSGCEGMGFSLFVGFRNFCLLGGDYVGSLMSNHGVKFWELLALNSGTTLCVLVVLPFIPKALLLARDVSRPKAVPGDVVPQPA